MVLARTPAFRPLAAVTTLPAVTGEAAKRAGQIARDYLARAHAELRARQDAGEGGLVLVAAYTDAVDHLVRFLSAEAAASYASRYARINQRCAVVGLGGYGRGELNPASDIDLLFLYPWKVNPYVETIAEVILYRRPADGVVWERAQSLGKVTEVTLPSVTTDDWFFAVATADAAGNQSIPQAPSVVGR